MRDYDDYETALYTERDPAVAAVERLHGLGYGREDISVMMEDKTREKAFSAIVNAKGSEGIAAGATIGGVLGAIVAGMTATGSVVAIAGTGGLATPLVVGPLAAALAGLGAGALAGGIVGGLVGAGIGEHRAKEIEKGLREGGILVAVKPKTHDHRDHVRKAFGEGSDVYARTERGELDRTVDYAGDASERVR
ncbi:MAG TPA: hypothetical protein VK760_12175 [Candidatus Acidoferrales bacterium]|nr:hypothetical protein [Candidatus Acidoferrales bacterium]